MRILTVTVLFVSAVALAVCPRGSEPFNGNCAEMPSPSESTLAPVVATSNEKPSRHPEPAYQRGEVNASLGLDERASAKKHDDESDSAIAQGKEAAGIK